MTKLFGSSGVRGLVNDNLTPVLAMQIGTAVGTYSKTKTVLVARDTRTSGQVLENALVAGLLSNGTNVKTLGILPTPTLAFLTSKMNADAGIMITASHNPPQYNGIKIFTSESLAYSEGDQDQIERIIANQWFKRADWQQIGEAQSTDQTQLYVEMITRSIQLHRKWHVVVDPGCGATYRLAPTVLAALGCKVTTLNAQPDGFFPARSPEPNKESLQPLAKTVKNLDADVGLAYDGDGDRVAFIDEKGMLADFDRVLAAYSGYVTGENCGGIVVTNVEASMCIDKMVETNHGRVIRTKVGDIYLSEAIKKKKAIFGGEPCGAWIHPKFHYCPDGILSSTLLLSALEEKDEQLTEFISETPRFETLRKNIPCNREAKHKIIKKVSEDFQSVFKDNTGISKVDGIRISLEDGWILIRESGTEPMIRLTVEGESLKTATNIMKKGIVLVEQSAREVN